MIDDHTPATQRQAPERPNVLEINDDLLHQQIVIEQLIEALQKSPKKSRERSLVITKLEEASMWANRGLRFGDR